METTSPLTRQDLEDLLGLAVWIISLEIFKAKEEIMASLADLVAEDVQLETEVSQIIQVLSDVEAQLAALQAAGLTPEQQAQVDQVAASLAALNSSITAALPAPPA